MVKHTQTIRRLLPMNRLSKFDDFVGLVNKEITFFIITQLGLHGLFFSPKLFLVSIVCD